MRAPPSALETARRLALESAPLLATAPVLATVRGLEMEQGCSEGCSEGSLAHPADSVTAYRDRTEKAVVVSALQSAEGSSHCQEGRFPVVAVEQLSPGNWVAHQR